jgi:thiamine-monophosphate kinase
VDFFDLLIGTFWLAYMLRHLGYKAVVVDVLIFVRMLKATQITVSVAVSNRFPYRALEELFVELRSL